MKKYMKKYINHVIRLLIRRWQLFSFVFVFFVLCCKSQKLDKKDDTSENSIALTMLVEDGYYVTDSLQTIVVRDFKSLNSFFSKVNRTRKPGIPVPSIDFTKEMVIVVCAGARKNVKRLVLRKKAETEDAVVILITEEPNKPSNSIIFYPFCLYKMSKNDKLISFIEE